MIRNRRHAGRMLAGLLLICATARADISGPEYQAAVAQSVSPALRDIPVSPGARHLREHALRLLPGEYAGQPAADPVLQSSSATTAPTTSGLGFAGVGQGDYGYSVSSAPPDTNGAVGATQYVQWVNTELAIFDKATGSLVKGPIAGNAVFAPLGGGCATNNDGDPIVQYDKIAQRWILTQFSVTTTPYLQCVAVSQTADATGAYNLYAFSYGTVQFPDYPKLAVWPDAYYATFNVFNNGTSFAGAKLCAYDRAAMLTGAAATQQCFQLSSAYGGVLASDLDGSLQPPAGTPNLMVGLGSSGKLNTWTFSVNWSNPGLTTLAGPTVVPVAAFTPACGGATCIPQPGTSQQLDSLADRLMYRFAYRNFGTYESWLVNHAVAVGGGKRSSVAGLRWYELRRTPGAGVALYQQGTFAPDATYRWVGSIAQDKRGNIALGYSASSTSLAPSVRLATRIPTDAPGTLGGEAILKAGVGSQLRNLSRWGDYSAMTVDPVDDCTFWYTNEYLKASGTFNWSTWISSFRINGCQ